MKHTVFLACIGLFILFTGCGGKKTETTSAGGEPRVIEVENVVAVQTATGNDGRPVFLVPFSASGINRLLSSLTCTNLDRVTMIFTQFSTAKSRVKR